eukprot:4010054-Amphidinium_carterae.1
MCSVLKERCLEQVILCSPGVTGSPCMFPCYANGPVGVAGLSMMKLAPIERIDNLIVNVTSSWPCMPSELPPARVGDVEVYPPDKVAELNPKLVEMVQSEQK